jgi:sulfhydrogenase subunit gamma (sulfur reductase)
MHIHDRPWEVEVVGRIEETPTIFTLQLRFTDPAQAACFHSLPGQFNMLYLHGVGEVPISMVSNPEDEHPAEHTIRAVGRVTRGMERLGVGDHLGLRGPYGRGWPLEAARGRDVVVVTGGLGCAPVVALIRHVLKHRDDFGRLVILQGVKHTDDLIWRQQYERWQQERDTQVLLAADVGGPNWPFSVGKVTVLFNQAEFDAERCAVMLCGPEMMMKASIDRLLALHVPAESIWLSIERNMQCGIGHCGHCQVGPYFVCQDGPVFHYPQLRHWLGVTGF